MSTETVSITLTPALADQLVVSQGRNVLEEHADRFQVLDADVAPYDPAFRDGTMSWCDTASDAVLYLAYERATGHDAVLLWDQAVDFDENGFVILSSRSRSQPAD